MKRILLAEADESAQRKWKQHLGFFEVEIHSAYNKKQARHFIRSRKFDLVVMSGCLTGRRFNTGELIEELRRTSPDLPIIAASDNPEIQRQLTKSGCNFEPSGGKAAVAGLIVLILALPPRKRASGML